MEADPSQLPCSWLCVTFPGVRGAGTRLGSCTCRRWGPVPLQCNYRDEGIQEVSLGNTVGTLGIRPGRSEAPSQWCLGSLFVLMQLLPSQGQTQTQ